MKWSFWPDEEGTRVECRLCGWHLFVEDDSVIERTRAHYADRHPQELAEHDARQREDSHEPTTDPDPRSGDSAAAAIHG